MAERRPLSMGVANLVHSARRLIEHLRVDGATSEMR